MSKNEENTPTKKELEELYSQNYGACLTSQIFSVNSRMKAIVSLMNVHSFEKTIISEINSLSQKISAAAETRNRVLHDSIGVHRESKTFRRAVVKADRRLIFEGKPVSGASISEERQIIMDCMNDFLALYDRVLSILATLRKKPPSELSPIEMTWQSHL